MESGWRAALAAGVGPVGRTPWDGLELAEAALWAGRCLSSQLHFDGYDNVHAVLEVGTALSSCGDNGSYL